MLAVFGDSHLQFIKMGWLTRNFVMTTPLWVRLKARN